MDPRENDVKLPEFLLSALVVTVWGSTPAQSFAANCFLSVNNWPYLEGMCWVEKREDGSFSVAMGQPGHKYFLILRDLGDGFAKAFWNDEKAGPHADEYLGKLRQEGICWLNLHARVCFVSAR